MNQRVLIALAVVILLQLSVLAGEYLGAVYPLWTGQEVRIRVVPVDPRSLFRGNYARLNFSLSCIPASAFSQPELIRNEEIVYVSLKQDSDGYYIYDHASLEKPDKGIFLRGRVQNRWRWSRASQFTIKYGIEAWFAPKEKALQLEKELRRGGIAVIMVADNGRATLRDVIAPKQGE